MDARARARAQRERAHARLRQAMRRLEAEKAALPAEAIETLRDDLARMAAPGLAVFQRGAIVGTADAVPMPGLARAAASTSHGDTV